MDIMRPSLHTFQVAIDCDNAVHCSAEKKALYP